MRAVNELKLALNNVNKDNTNDAPALVRNKSSPYFNLPRIDAKHMDPEINNANIL